MVVRRQQSRCKSDSSNNAGASLTDGKKQRMQGNAVTADGLVGFSRTEKAHLCSLHGALGGSPTCAVSAAVR